MNVAAVRVPWNLTRASRRFAIVLTGFLATSAVGGGVSLLVGGGRPDARMLEGSPFSSFTIPALALVFLIGGSSFAALVLVALHHSEAQKSLTVAGILLITFECVEIAAIGSPAGVARTLQALYLAIGVALVALGLRRIDKGPFRSEHRLE